MQALPGSALDATVPAPQWVADWWLPETETVDTTVPVSIELEGVVIAGGQEAVVLPGAAEVAGRLLRPPVGDPAG